MAHEEGLESDPEEGCDVDSRVGIEALILGRNGGMDETRGKFVIADKGSVLYMICSNNLPFLREDLGRQLAVRILEFLDSRDV